MSLNSNITKCFDIKHDINKIFYIQSYINDTASVILSRTNCKYLMSISIKLNKKIYGEFNAVKQ